MPKDFSKARPVLTRNNKYTDKEVGITPKILRLLMRWSGLIHRLVLRKYERSEWWGLEFFVVRGKALEHDLLENICTIIQKNGFELIEVKAFEPEDIERMSKYTRGGNWEGGEPVACLAVFDPAPTLISGPDRKLYPEMDNVKMLRKEDIRIAINDPLPEEKRSNYLHATDNLEEAWAYIHVAMPERIDKIKEKIRNHKNY